MNSLYGVGGFPWSIGGGKDSSAGIGLGVTDALFPFLPPLSPRSRYSRGADAEVALRPFGFPERVWATCDAGTGV